MGVVFMRSNTIYDKKEIDYGTSEGLAGSRIRP